MSADQRLRPLGPEVKGEVHTKFHGWGRSSLIATAVVMLVTGTYFVVRAAPFARSNGELASLSGSRVNLSLDNGTARSRAAAWEVSASNDPMTDATVHQASTTLSGERFDVEVTVTCSSAGELTYAASSFDKDGQAAPMRSIRTGPRVWGTPAGSQSYSASRVDPGYQSVTYQVRADDQPARSLTTTNPAYDNQVLLSTGPIKPLYADGSGIDDAERMAAASQVMLRLFMTTGEQTIELQQGDRGFRSVVQPCLTARDAKRQQLTIARQKAEQRDSADKQAYVDRLYDDGSIDSDTLVWLANNRNVRLDQARLTAKRAREAPHQIPLP